MARRGRPKKPNARRGGVHIRLNDEEVSMLEELSDKNNKPRAEIFRELMVGEYQKSIKKE